MKLQNTYTGIMFCYYLICTSAIYTVHTHLPIRRQTHASRHFPAEAKERRSPGVPRLLGLCMTRTCCALSRPGAYMPWTSANVGGHLGMSSTCRTTGTSSSKSYLLWQTSRASSVRTTASHTRSSCYFIVCSILYNVRKISGRALKQS